MSRSHRTTSAVDPTEAAHVIVELVTDTSWFSDDEAICLRDLLANELSIATPGRERTERLGLLIEMIADGTGQFVTSTRYDELRQQRLAGGTEWPDSTTISRAYGGWLEAVRTCARLVFGNGLNISSRGRKGRPRPANFTTLELLNGLERCYVELRGDEAGKGAPWPRQSEYVRWLHLLRQIARHAGQPTPRVSYVSGLRRTFGSYEQAVEIARNRYEEAARGQAASGACDPGYEGPGSTARTVREGGRSIG